MSSDRATSLDRCQLPSRSARRIETLCSPERRRIACRKVCWSIDANLVIKRLGRRSLFVVELRALKGCPGILRLDYLGKERTNSRPRGGRHSVKRINPQSATRRAFDPIVLQGGAEQG